RVRSTYADPTLFELERGMYVDDTYAQVSTFTRPLEYRQIGLSIAGLDIQVSAIPSAPAPVMVSDGFAPPARVIGCEVPFTVGFHGPDCAGGGYRAGSL